MIHPFTTLCEQVGEWSRRNFGDQESKWLEPTPLSLYPDNTPACCLQRLNHIAPLLGIIEEIGELATACHLSSHDYAAARDAVGDIMIYLADYLVRMRPNCPDPASMINWLLVDDRLRIECPESSIGGSSQFLLTHIGQLVHRNLKRHQGIRGYHDNHKFFPEIRLQLNDILIGVGRLYALSKPDRQCSVHEILIIAVDTWQQVKQRDWKKNPTNAADITPTQRDAQVTEKRYYK